MTTTATTEPVALPLSERAERESQFFFKIQAESPALAATMAAWEDRTTVSDLIAALSERGLPLVRIGDDALEPLPPMHGMFGRSHP
jgi:hypothetical protein